MYINITKYKMTYAEVECISNPSTSLLKLRSFSARSANVSHILQLFLHMLAISSDWWYTYPSEKYELVNWDI